MFADAAFFHVKVDRLQGAILRGGHVSNASGLRLEQPLSPVVIDFDV
jgi:hypothetical protein